MKSCVWRVTCLTRVLVVLLAKKEQVSVVAFEIPDLLMVIPFERFLLFLASFLAFSRGNKYFNKWYIMTFEWKEECVCNHASCVQSSCCEWKLRRKSVRLAFYAWRFIIVPLMTIIMKMMMTIMDITALTFSAAWIQSWTSLLISLLPQLQTTGNIIFHYFGSLWINRNKLN